MSRGSTLAFPKTTLAKKARRIRTGPPSENAADRCSSSSTALRGSV